MVFVQAGLQSAWVLNPSGQKTKHYPESPPNCGEPVSLARGWGKAIVGQESGFAGEKSEIRGYPLYIYASSWGVERVKVKEIYMLTSFQINSLWPSNSNSIRIIEGHDCPTPGHAAQMSISGRKTQLFL